MNIISGFKVEYQIREEDRIKFKITNHTHCCDNICVNFKQLPL